MSDDIAGFEAAVAGARSLGEVAARLAAQPGVVSVETTPYLLKSHPPRRDFAVSFVTPSGEVRKIVQVLEIDDRRFEFASLREAPR